MKSFALCSSLIIAILIASSSAKIRVPRAIHLDIEPHVNPVWFTDMVGTGKQFVEMYQKIHDLLAPKGVPINADIPLWLDDHPYLVYNGVNKSCTEWLMPYVNKMTIMAYRDWGLGNRDAPSAREENGNPQSIVNSCEQELQLAPAYGVKISAAVEVSCRVDPSWVSFCLDGSTYMEQQLAIAESYLKSHYTAFDGIVVHYRDTWAQLRPSYTLNGDTTRRETYEWSGVDTLTDSSRMDQLFSFAKSHAVKAIYFDMQVIVNDLDTYMPSLITLLETADKNDIDVEFMLGEADWALTPQHDACLQMVGKTADLIHNLRQMASEPITVPSPSTTPLSAQQVVASSKTASTSQPTVLGTSQTPTISTQATVNAGTTKVTPTISTQATTKAGTTNVESASQPSSMDNKSEGNSLGPEKPGTSSESQKTGEDSIYLDKTSQPNMEYELGPGQVFVVPIVAIVLWLVMLG